MPNTNPARRATRTAVQLTELSLAAPQVIAHRLTRMALSNPSTLGRDQPEFAGMIVEKQVALFEACMAMWLEAARWQQTLFMSILSGATAAQHQAAARRAAARIAGSAIGPFHRKAVANARRLARTPLG